VMQCGIKKKFQSILYGTALPHTCLSKA